MRFILPSLKWNKAIDGFDFDFGNWMEYERSQLPPDTIFPRLGQIWEAIGDCEVGFKASIPWPGSRFGKYRCGDGTEVTMPDWALFFAPSGVHPANPWCRARLPKGERVRVVEGTHYSASDPKPLRACLQPLRYEELQEEIVPQEFRNAPGYRGYRLYVSTARPRWSLNKETAETAYLNQDFRLVGNVA